MTSKFEILSRGASNINGLSFLATNSHCFAKSSGALISLGQSRHSLFLILIQFTNQSETIN
jgi:hypothetical protein